MGYFDDAATGAKAGYNEIEGGAPFTAGGVSGSLAGILGRYAMSPIESLQTLGSSMQGVYDGKGYNPDEVTAALMDVGMLSSPASSALMPAGSLGMFGGKLGKVAKNAEFGPLDYWLPLDHPDRTANFEKWGRGAVVPGAGTGDLQSFFMSGTNKPLFDAFDVRFSGSNTGNADALDFAAWLSDHGMMSSSYANGMPRVQFEKMIRDGTVPERMFPRVIPGHVRAENPFVYDAGFKEYEKGLFDQIAAEARKPEYDALFVKNVRDGMYGNTDVGNVIAIKNPNQFKSIWNSGEYGETGNFMRGEIPALPSMFQEENPYTTPLKPEDLQYDEQYNPFGMI
ncbi:hypothetical protein [Desulfovibrio gilichinskyi]|uniref:Uncharacterized protein n=1 Tax=Desulfovibrio gilichinskyi TaxID=1519643 RepID=A0A1X7C3R2_9BACT|nr:hypothetical protein [Desulfovibrio gilichinskyi]SME89416.1 hypothetical protein SAMN06295933_0297 [Desulfovibrio gilichinskyi]